MSKSLSWAPPVPPSSRHAAARALRYASHRLARAARALVASARAPAVEPVIEFHAEAGAPEGALYVDGKLVGMLPGVNRL